MDINPVLATAMLSGAARKKLERYAEEKLFAPLGLKRAAWQRADEKGLVSGGWGLRLLIATGISSRLRHPVFAILSAKGGDRRKTRSLFRCRSRRGLDMQPRRLLCILLRF
jgi:CubicO group peptidase (beta-lactamase class C family)